MEAWELANKLRAKEGIIEVWTSGELLTLDENDVPELETWYMLARDSETIDKIYRYEGGEWVAIND